MENTESACRVLSVEQHAIEQRKRAEGAERDFAATAVLLKREEEAHLVTKRHAERLEMAIEALKDCGQSDASDACGECVACYAKNLCATLAELNEVRQALEVSRDANAVLRAERELLTLSAGRAP